MLSQDRCYPAHTYTHHAHTHTHTHTRTQNPTSNGLWIKLVFPPASLLFYPPPLWRRGNCWLSCLLSGRFGGTVQTHWSLIRSSGIPFRTQFVHSVEKLWPLSRCCCDIFLPYDTVYCIRPIPHFTTGIVRVCFLFVGSLTDRTSIIQSRTTQCLWAWLSKPFLGGHGFDCYGLGSRIWKCCLAEFWGITLELSSTHVAKGCCCC